jgi:hypothetical protein
VDFKDVLSVVGVLLSVGAAVPYIRDILKHKTKPHPITWLIWSLLATSGAVVQWVGGGGAASLVLGSTGLMNVVILILALRQAKFKATRFDTLILSMAIASLVAGRIAGSPDLTAVLLTSTMMLGFIPTYRKSIAEPHHETMSLYFLSGIKQIIGITALSAYNMATLVFPAAVAAANLGLVTLLMMRRRLLRVKRIQEGPIL